MFTFCCLAWGQTIVGIKAVIQSFLTSFKRTYASTVVFKAPDPVAGHCWLTSLPEPAEHSQASLTQCHLGSLFLSPGSWCTQCCALLESVSPVLGEFCNQIPLAFKVKFPGGSDSLCQIPRLGNLLWTLELLQNCKNFFGVIVLPFVGSLLSLWLG